MLKDPITCPFCGGNLLQALEPSELGIDQSIWTILHWQCIECGETFDKIIEETYSDEFYEDDEGTNLGTDN